MGMAAITYQDLSAWQDISGVRLTPWEADTILEMDSAVRAVMAKEQKT